MVLFVSIGSGNSNAFFFRELSHRDKRFVENVYPPFLRPRRGRTSTRCFFYKPAMPTASEQTFVLPP